MQRRRTFFRSRLKGLRTRGMHVIWLESDIQRRTASVSTSKLAAPVVMLRLHQGLSLETCIQLCIQLVAIRGDNGPQEKLMHAWIVAVSLQGSAVCIGSPTVMCCIAVVLYVFIKVE